MKNLLLTLWLSLLFRIGNPKVTGACLLTARPKIVKPAKKIVISCYKNSGIPLFLNKYVHIWIIKYVFPYIYFDWKNNRQILLLIWYFVHKQVIWPWSFFFCCQQITWQHNICQLNQRITAKFFGIYMNIICFFHKLSFKKNNAFHEKFLSFIQSEYMRIEKLPSPKWSPTPILAIGRRQCLTQ